MVSSLFDSFSDAPYTVRVRFGTLKESTVASEDIVHAVLCGAVEFWRSLISEVLIGQTCRQHTFRRKNDRVIRPRRVG